MLLNLYNNIIYDILLHLMTMYIFYNHMLLNTLNI